MSEDGWSNLGFFGRDSVHIVGLENREGNKKSIYLDGWCDSIMCAACDRLRWANMIEQCAIDQANFRTREDC